MTVRVERAVVADAELVAAVRHLVPQLSSAAPPIEAHDLESIVASPATMLLVARDDDDSVLGILTLAVFRIPTGVRARIEDVVVDDAARRVGAGRALVQAAIDLSIDAGARTIDLTSRPSREAPHNLYKSMGFEERETTVYRYAIYDEAPSGA